jgi:2-polyprenyl-6-methoxyphenol hydroxylase-like FAD-dependent oxidoreductase
MFPTNEQKKRSLKINPNLKMATKEKSVLISGASIAGLTMAYWMDYYGFKVTVVEIGAAPRRGGSPIDVRGDALDTARRMGILDAIKAAKD